MDENVTNSNSTTSKRQVMNNVSDLAAFIGTILLVINRWAEGYEHPFIFTGIGLWCVFLALRLVQWKTNTRHRNRMLIVILATVVAFTVFYLCVMQDGPFGS